MIIVVSLSLGRGFTLLTTCGRMRPSLVAAIAMAVNSRSVHDHRRIISQEAFSSMRYCLLAPLLLIALPVWSAEKKIQMRDLPPAVQQAVQAQSAGASVKGFAKETENGTTTYEAEMLVNGHGKDVTFDAAGKVISVEEEVALERIPSAAKAAIDQATAGGKIKKVEQVTEGDTISYEASYVKAGKSREFAVKPDRSLVKGK
jgi:uncharacterized membrane protein YkoI